MAEEVRPEQVRLDRADQLVLIYPLFWWSLPALKGCVQRVFVSAATR